MASQTNSYNFGNQTAPSSSATPRRGWWSRPIVIYPATNDRKPTCMEELAYNGPFYSGFLTVVALYYIFLFIDSAHSHAKFSIHSISVSPHSASAMWCVDFLVKNPSSSYFMYYESDDFSVKLGHLNAAVLNITSKRESRDVTAFSLAFVVEEEGNRTSVQVSEQLDVILRGKHKRYVHYDAAGYFYITCPNLTRSSDEKIVCQSSFTHLEIIEP